MRSFSLATTVRVEGVWLVFAERIARHNEIHVFGIGRQVHLKFAVGFCAYVAVCGFLVGVDSHDAVCIAVGFVAAELKLDGFFAFGVKFDDIGSECLEIFVVDKFA